MKGPRAAGITSSLGQFQLSTLDWQRHLAAKNTLVTKCSLIQPKLSTTAILDQTSWKGTFQVFRPNPRATGAHGHFLLCQLCRVMNDTLSTSLSSCLPTSASRKSDRGGGEGPVVRGGREGEVACPFIGLLLGCRRCWNSSNNKRLGSVLNICSAAWKTVRWQ